MVNQHAKWLKVTRGIGWRSADRVPELPAHLARVAAGPQRLLPPGPGFHRPRHQQEARGRPGVPAAGHQHPAVDDRAHLASQPTTSTSSSPASSRASTGSTPDQAGDHCARGLGIWDWASNDDGDPDVVIACAGDVPTLEALAAVSILRAQVPPVEDQVRQRRRPDAAAGRHRAPTRAVPTATSTPCSPRTSR